MKPGVLFCIFTPVKLKLSQMFFLFWIGASKLAAVAMLLTRHSNSGGNSNTAGSASALYVQQVLQIKDKCFVCPSPLGWPKQ